MTVKLAFVLIFEHIVFGVCKLIDLMVPDIPASLDIKIKRERFLAKEALQDAEQVSIYHTREETIVLRAKMNNLAILVKIFILARLYIYFFFGKYIELS